MESSANIGHLRRSTRLGEGEGNGKEGEFISRGPLAHAAGSGTAGVGMSRCGREREMWRDTWTDRRIDGEGDEEREGERDGEREGTRKGAKGARGNTDVYLAFPIPAHRLVSCLLSLSPFRSRCLRRSFFVDGAHRTRVRVRKIRGGGCRGVRVARGEGGERTSLEAGDAG